MGEGQPPLAAESLFSQRLVEEGGRRFLEQADGSRVPWTPPESRPLYGPLPPACGQTRWNYKLYRLPWMVRGCRLWWALGVFIQVMYAAPSYKDVGRVATNHWQRWLTWTACFVDPPCAFRKAIDKSGKDRSWFRFLLEGTASTAGLLAWLVCCSVEGREDTPRMAAQLLESLCSFFLGHMDIQLHVPLDPSMAAAFLFEGCTNHPSLAEAVPVDGGQIWLQPILSQMEGVSQNLFHQVCHLLETRGQVENGRVSVATLLVELNRIEDLQWLSRALLLPLSVFLEAGVLEREHSGNPVDFPVSLGACVDHHLQDLLGQGGGATGSTDLAVVPEAHNRSFKALRKQHTRWGKKKAAQPNIERGRRVMLCRYQAACKDHFSKCSSITVALDGSRVGGREMLLVIVFGTDGEGNSFAAWAPPQAMSKV